MSVFTPTYEQKQYIIRNRRKVKIIDMAKKIGCARSTIRNFMKKSGIALTRKEQYDLTSKWQLQKSTASPDEDKYILENYLSVPVKSIARHLKRSPCFVSIRMRQLKLKIPDTLIQERQLASRFKPGMTPANKGKKQSEFMTKEGIDRSKAYQFKKGNLPHNTKSDGVISTVTNTLRSGKKILYKTIRISLSEWRMLHVYKWEKKYGPVPKGYVVIFKNGNTSDCSLRNLKLVTRIELMKMNTIHRYPPELKQLIKLNSKLKKKIKNATKKNNF